MSTDSPSADDFRIKSLGPCRFPSPLSGFLAGMKAEYSFVQDSERVLVDDSLGSVLAAAREGRTPPSLEIAGPREQLFFDPAKVRAAIVTCGGLCPGINDVVRGLVMELHYRYGAREIHGIRYGYEGFIPRFGHEPIPLLPDRAKWMHNFGGSLLGSSRGEQDTGEIVDTLERMGIDQLFVIGGDGTLRGALDIAREVERRGQPRAVIGIPKTIDNDIEFIDRSFGFDTAFSEAVKAIQCAHAEAIGAKNGVGLVKLMGRHSGFIACHAALACNEVNFVLIPEVPFALEGPRGFLESLRARLRERKHAVVVLAEGAGQDLIAGETGRDASGNVRLKDIGLFMKDRIESHFRAAGEEVNMKYIDPSYIIRSVPATPQDGVYCSRLAQNAVHAAMAGKTEMVPGQWHGHFVNIPAHLTTARRRRVDPDSDLWLSVLETTGQPPIFGKGE